MSIPSDLPPPIDTKVAFEPVYPSAAAVMKMNEILGRPWNSHERTNGRTIALSLFDGENKEALVQYFGNWSFKQEGDQREGDFWRVTPRGSSYSGAYDR